MYPILIREFRGSDIRAMRKRGFSWNCGVLLNCSWESVGRWLGFDHVKLAGERGIMRQKQHKQGLKMGVGGICEYVKHGAQSWALQVIVQSTTNTGWFFIVELRVPRWRLIREQEKTRKLVSNCKSVGESCPKEMKGIVKRQEKMGG